MTTAREDMLFHTQTAIPELVKGLKEDPSKYDKIWDMWINDMKWKQQDQQEMLEWTANYLKFAGYGNPGRMPRFWKAIIMTAFPVLIETPDGRGVGPEGFGTYFKKDPIGYITKIAHWQSGFLKMMDYQELKWNESIAHNCPMFRMIQG